MIHEIVPKIMGKKVILFGEVHGTKEIPEILSKFFSDLARDEDFNICLEIPDEFQERINLYLSMGDDEILKNIPFFSKEHCLDGRNSLEYIELIRTVYNVNLKYKKNLEIFCVFPSSSKGQNKMEEGIFVNVMRSFNNGRRTFVIMGNIHASKKEISIFNKSIIPAGFLISKRLKEDVFSILLTAKAGEIFNNGLRKINFREDDLFEGNFDYVVRLEKVTPCSFLQ